MLNFRLEIESMLQSLKILIINGPNLNLLGIREQEIYGKISFQTYFKQLISEFPQLHLEYFQSNVEGELINQLHEAGFSCRGIILNAGAYTHTSVAIGDAVAAIKAPVIEVHISNLYQREAFRQHSLIAKNCIGTIGGFGLNSYRLAVEALLLHIKESL